MREAIDPGGHCELGDLVAVHLVVALLEAAHLRKGGAHELVEVEFLHEPVRRRSNCDHPRWRTGEEALLEEACEQEGAEEVLGEAAVDALARARAGRRHAARSVDQYVDRAM